MILTILTAASFAHKPDAFNTALLIHVSSWIAQFAGHFLAEGRSPALLDNLVGGACFSLSPLSRVLRPGTRELTPCTAHSARPRAVLRAPRDPVQTRLQPVSPEEHPHQHH